MSCGHGFALRSASASSATRAAFADEVPLREHLPAAGVLKAQPVRVGADLQLAVADGLGGDAAADLDEALLDVGPLRREEELVLAPDRVGGARRAQSLALAQLLLGGDQQTDAIVHGHRERIDLDRRRVRRASPARPRASAASRIFVSADAFAISTASAATRSASSAVTTCDAAKPHAAVGDRADAEAE